ncbi:putative flavoprotein oxygenase [Cellvibrio sp. BR]|nr:putative flavoprotein oxygenase [Cellvibrio sp. BR]
MCINQAVSQQAHLSSPDVMFAINVLSVNHQDVSNVCAGRDPSKNRFGVGHWVTDESGLPVLADALAVFICKTDKVMTYGTHKIVIGAISNVIVNGEEVNPLLYANGSYGALGSIE